MTKSLMGSASALAILLMLGGVSAASAQSADSTDYWSGFYAGITAGVGGAAFSGAFQDSFGTCTNNSCASFSDLSLFGGILGIHAGYNWQLSPSEAGTPAFFIGLEGDVSISNWSGEALSPETSDGGVTGQVDLLATVRGRIGVAVDKTLFYATAGLAINNAGGTTFETGSSVGSGEGTYNFAKLGAVVGAGLEYAVDEQTSIRTEGLYYYFGDVVDISDNPSGRSNDTAVFDGAFVLRMGASRKF